MLQLGVRTHDGMPITTRGQMSITVKVQGDAMRLS